MARRIALLVVLLLVAAGWSANADGVGRSFVDPTALVVGGRHVHLGDDVYVGPFARLLAASRARAVHAGDESDIQDSVVVDALGGTVRLGEQGILAHGSTAKRGAEVGERGTCPGGAAHCPSFVGFNSEVDGRIVEKDAMVLHLARVGPGVRIPSGRKVPSGRNVTRHADVMAKTEQVTGDDRAFMAGVVEVNVELGHGYAQLQAESASNVRGINHDPGGTAFNPVRDLPKVAGTPTRNPSTFNRVIGDVRLADPFSPLRTVLSSLGARG